MNSKTPENKYFILKVTQTKHFLILQNSAQLLICLSIFSVPYMPPMYRKFHDFHTHVL